MNDFLSGFNFARHSDCIFSETIPENGTHKTYINENFELDSGNIIFCKIDFVHILFDILKDESEIKNLKLITHEGDIPVTENLFSIKPICISKWYAQNVDYEHKDLIPIPIGLANDYCKITLKYNNIKRIGTPKKLLYINHRVDTNLHYRSWIYENFETNNWCTVDFPNLSLVQYKKQLDNHKYILCPRGNGIDTHRVWESLYHGIIPILEKCPQTKTLEDLPAIVVNSFTEVTKNFLEEQSIKLVNKKFNMEKLKVSWWIDFIRKSG